MGQSLVNCNASVTYSDCLKELRENALYILHLEPGMDGWTTLGDEICIDFIISSSAP